MSKKKIIIMISVIILLGVIAFSIWCFVITKKSNKDELIEENINVTEVLDNENKEETQDSEIVIEEETDAEGTKDYSNTTSNNENKTTNSNNDSSTNSSNNNTTNNNTSTDTTTPSNETSDSIDTSTDSDEVTTTSYVGVPDPNNIFYSIHQGHIDFKDLDECESKSYDYLILDVNDIYGSWCIEVVDSEGTVLGAYLQIKCYSGNCDKYKGY